MDKAAAQPQGSSVLPADCTETSIMPSPLSPRPTLHRISYAASPKRVRHHHRRHAARKAPSHRAHVVKHVVKHKAKHHRRRPAHRPTERRAILHRVTYASPLCASRSTAINDMLGLPGYDITQPPVVAEAVAEALPPFIALAPVIGPPPITGGGGGPTGPTGPGPIVFPVYPPGPGPIIIGPPGPPVTPPVTSPLIPAAPEPSSWAMMLTGMMLIGQRMRRRARPSVA